MGNAPKSDCCTLGLTKSVRMPKKILVLGRDGQLGFELRRSLAPLGDVAAVGRSECDLTYPLQLSLIHI